MMKRVIIVLFISLLFGCSSAKTYNNFDAALKSIMAEEKINSYENKGYIEKDGNRVYIFSKKNNYKEYLIRAIVLRKEDSKISVEDTTSDILLNIEENEVGKGIIINGNAMMLVCGNNKLDLSNSYGVLVRENNEFTCKITNWVGVINEKDDI